MASRPNRKFTNLREQDALMEAFYNELDEGEKSFLGNPFKDEDDKDDDYELEVGSDNNGAENEADVTEVEQEIEQTQEEEVNIENIIKEKLSIESQKQMFETLDNVPNDNNYDNAPP